VSALQPESVAVTLANTAIGLDASVFLKISANSRGEEIIDYLGSKHTAPLVLPGQAIQEFWNNQLQAVDTVTANLQKKFDGFQNELKKVDPNFGLYADKINQLLDEFRAEHGHVYDAATVRRTLAFLEFLRQRASVPYTSRTNLRDIALQRKKTKTPPGFKDDGDGDFFIWADFLTGLQWAAAKGATFARAVLVTRDQKLDWSRAGIAHPILVAEVRALLGVSFEIWNDEKLSLEITKALTEESPTQEERS